MSAKILSLITGANQGLGYYAAQQLAATGKYHILLGSRDVTKAHNAIQSLTEDKSYAVQAEDFEPIQIDVTSDDSIKAAAQHVQQKYGKLDILMVNAGIAGQQSVAADGSGPSIRELYQQHFNTNLFGAVAVVEAFIPLLRSSTTPGGKRIAFTSSALASLKMAAENEQYSAKSFPVYRSTKTAMSMIMLHYAQSLASEGFVVSASDPGYCSTNLNGFHGFKDPKDGAKVLVRAATDAKEKVHGNMVDENGVVPW